MKRFLIAFLAVFLGAAHAPAQCPANCPCGCQVGGPCSCTVSVSTKKLAVAGVRSKNLRGATKVFRHASGNAYAVQGWARPVSRYPGCL